MMIRQMYQFHHKRLGVTLDVDEHSWYGAMARLKNDDPCWRETDQVVSTIVWRAPDQNRRLLKPIKDLFNAGE